MALSAATITYDLSDYGLADFDSRRTKVWATNNVNGPVVDTEGNAIHLGSANGTVNADGTGSITVPTPGTGSNPASWQTTIHVDYPDRNADRGRGRLSLGPFTITVSANLADLVDEQAIPPDYAGELVATVEAGATAAAASATSAAASADAAATIVGLTGEDEAVALLIDTPASDTATALSATIATAVTGQAGPLVGVSDVDSLAVGTGEATTWETPDATGIIVHPSVCFFPQGFAGYRWWAAATPYAGSDNQLENPCVYVSTNGLDWTEPPGLTNPVHPTPASGYNSDTHLMQGPDGNLHLFFREYSSAPPAAEKIMHTTSADGITWETPVAVLSDSDSVRRLMSPAVWFDGAQWVMLAVEILADPRRVMRFTATDPRGTWTYDQDATFDLAWGAGRSVWHLDAQLVGDQVIATLQDAVADGSGGDVYLAVSHDNGRSFTRATTAIKTGNNYRSTTLPRVTETGLALDVWIGGGSPSWGATRYTAAVPRVEATDVTALDASVSMLLGKTKTDPYVFGDDFNRADTPTAMGTAPSGQTWTVGTGTLGVVSSKAKAPTAANHRAIVDVGIANFILTCDLYPIVTGGHQAWIVIRHVDSNNYLRIGRDGLGMGIQRVTAGAVTLLHNFGSIAAADTKVTITANGSSITVETGGLSQTVTETQGQTATVIGLHLNQTTVNADNLLVRKLP